MSTKTPGFLYRHFPLLMISGFDITAIFMYLVIQLPCFSRSVLTILAMLFFILVFPGFIFKYIQGQFFPLKKYPKLLQGPFISLLFWIIVSEMFNKTPISLELAHLWPILVGLFIVFHGFLLSQVLSSSPQTNSYIEQIQDALTALITRCRSKSDQKSNLTTGLFFLFLILLILFSLVRIQTLPTADIWYHLTIVSDLMADGSLSNSMIYDGKVAFHYLLGIGAIFSKLSPYWICKGIGAIQLLLAVGAFKGLLDEFQLTSSLKSLLCLTFLLSAFGTILNHIQAWPTSLSISFGLLLFKNFLHYQQAKVNAPYSQFKSQSGMRITQYYLTQAFLLITLVILHIVNTLIFLFPILFTLAFFLKSNWHRFLWESLFYLGFVGIHIGYNPSLMQTFSLTLIFTNYSGWHIFFILLGLLGAGASGYWYLARFIQKSTFPLTNHEATAPFNPDNSALLIERKYFWPVILPLLLLVFPLIFYFLILRTKTFFPVNIVTMMLAFDFEAALIAIIVITILIFRQYNLQGKILYLVLLFFVLFTVFLIVFSQIYSITLRFVNLLYPLLLPALGYSLYYLHSHRKIDRFKSKVIVAVVSFMLISVMYHSLYDEYITTTEVNYWESFATLNDPPISGSERGGQMIIGSFYWKYCANYYLADGSVNHTPFQSYYLTYLHLDQHNYSAHETHSQIGLDDFQAQHNLSDLFLFFGQVELTDGILTQNRENYGIIDAAEYNRYYNQASLIRVGIATQQKNLYYVIG